MKKIERLDIVRVNSDKEYLQEHNGKLATVIWLDCDYPVAMLQTHDSCAYWSMKIEDVVPTGGKAELSSLLGTSYEFSSDTEIDDNMPFFEGTYRTPGEFWKLILIHPSTDINEVKCEMYNWKNGIETIEVNTPRDFKFDCNFVRGVLTKYYPNTKWNLMYGPSSMSLR